ncbi:hypothetical protein GN244_ATG18100 [Phytophthora infestans]|uniref:Uncharacterized protein n=1 Tax=Phytophthora infestans TaxID=4787 RepID=A0A833SGD8_PHYIN|nr:hypothetical protein GN244_ATG18100 [Phytophthora infestans]
MKHASRAKTPIRHLAFARPHQQGYLYPVARSCETATDVTSKHLQPQVPLTGSCTKLDLADSAVLSCGFSCSRIVSYADGSYYKIFLYACAMLELVLPDCWWHIGGDFVSLSGGNAARGG